ncbi:DPH3 homolog [Marmota marmota marmota]|uniref:DPH3 homolog n=1 Tax=Marmota marmota marmota TaxID=9994 RepID=UPI000762303D|nr:DPH3 homolog [Marmota marmota marmota]
MFTRKDLSEHEQNPGSLKQSCTIRTVAQFLAGVEFTNRGVVRRLGHLPSAGPNEPKAVFHVEVEMEDFQHDEDSETYFYPCPCGDNFSITKEDLENGEDVATCPSCSLIIKVIYDKDQFMCGETVPAPSSNKELVKC